MGRRVAVNLEECPENKTHQDLLVASRWLPLSVFLLKWGAEQIGHPTWSEWQQAFTGGLICMCLHWHCWTIPKLISTSYTDWSHTAAPWGPGGPGIPAWPGPPCRKENRLRINCHVLLRLNFLIIITGNLYLYSRNARCAIFSINTRQALNKQASQSADLKSGNPFWAPTVCVFTHILSLFANCSLWALDTSAALQKINTLSVCRAYQDRCSPFKFWETFHLLCLRHCFVINFKGKTLRESHTLTPLSPASPGGPWGPSSPCKQHREA